LQNAVKRLETEKVLKTSELC